MGSLNTTWKAQMENFGDRSRPRMIDQDPKRKSTTRMKKPTHRLQELHLNCRRHHLVLISLVCCFCLRGLGFIRKIYLVWSLCFLSSWVSGFDLSLFFCLRVLGFCLIFLCFVFLSSWVSWFDLCFLLVCLCMFVCFKFWFLGYLVELKSHRLDFFDINFHRNRVCDTWFATVNSSHKYLRC